MNILFVCTGNTCRSPMAAYLMRKILDDRDLLKEVNVSSAGLGAFDGDEIAHHAGDVLKDLYDIDASSHRSSQVTSLKLEAQDLILTMTSSHAKQIKDALPSVKMRVMTLVEAAILAKEFLDRLNEGEEASRAIYADLNNGDIKDPFGQTRAVYEKTAKDLEMYLNLIANYIEVQLRNN